MFHFALSLIVSEDKECKTIWSNMPYVCNMNPHVLQFSFGKTYGNDEYDFIVSSCFVHKLTYKFNKNLLTEVNENMLMHFLKN